MKGSPRRLGMVSMAAIFSAVVALVSLIFFSTRVTLGVAAGGALMSGNIYLLRRVIGGLLGKEPPTESEVKKRRRFLLFQYLLKTLGIMAVLAALIWKTDINPAGILAGITAATTGLLYVGLRDAELED